MRFVLMVLCLWVASLWAFDEGSTQRWGLQSQNHFIKWGEVKEENQRLNQDSALKINHQKNNAQEFMISYKAKIDNSLFSGEEYKVSKVLHPRGQIGLLSGDFMVFKKCQIIPNAFVEPSEMQKMLKENKEQVLECLYPSGVQIYDEAISKNLQAKSKTILTLDPKRVLAELVNGVIELNVLEKK